MSDENNENKIEHGTPESLKLLRESLIKNQEKEKQEADPNFWASMTPEQTLEYLGVTQKEIDRVFPPDFKPMTKKFTEMSTEEQLQRSKELIQRMALNKPAKSDTAQEMPNANQINQINIDNAKDFLNDTNLQILLKKVEEAASYKETKKAKTQAQLLEAQKELERIEKEKKEKNDAFRLGFNAAKAKQLWIDNIKKDSNLDYHLSQIYEHSKTGKEQTTLAYVSIYDRMQLEELGFVLAKTNGKPATYTVSWNN